MAEFDAETLAEQVVLIGLLSREQIAEAKFEAENGSIEALSKTLLRKGLLTNWQLNKLLKGDPGGYVYGGCKVLFHIAEGTFARVYRGQRMPGKESVAIKVLRRRFSTDQAAVSRFNQEAEAGLKLVHNNIVRILDFGSEVDSHYMIMEYVEGSNLRDFLKIRHRVEHEKALPLMLGLAEGLNYSLSKGVTHRDIKGTNILISTRGEAKLVDFGLATIGDERSMETAHGQRTVDYSALERTCGSPKGDPRSDIYFLGCVFYQMLTGVLPLPEVESSDPLAKMLKRSFGAIRPLSEHRHAPPERLTEIIEKMMQVKLEKRYQTMQEVLDDLKAYKEESEKTAALPPEPPRLKKRKKERSGSDSFLTEIFGNDQEDESEPKHVLCVEVQEQIRQVFRKVLNSMGFRAILVGDAERAAERYREDPPDLVVFDADGLGPEGLDAFLDMHEKAHDDGHELAALVLLGPRQGELSSKLPTDDRIVVLTKPIKMKDVQDALTQLTTVNQ